MSGSTCLVAYTSMHGTTHDIAEVLARRLREHGLEVDLVDLVRAPTDPAGYDLVVAGGSVHVEHHRPELVGWLRESAPALGARPLALFSVSLTAAGDAPDDREHVSAYLDELRTAAPTADVVSPFAGALRYRSYRLPTRWMMRRIARRKGLSTDVSRDHVFTDFSAVGAFADRAAALLGRVAVDGGPVRAPATSTAAG